MKTAVFAAALCAASAVLAGERWLERPETGPVAVSIANELSQVYRRAEVWLAARETEIRDACPLPGPDVPPLPVETLWAALDGAADAGLDPFDAALALARSLDAAGADLVFIAGEPVEWRKALVRAMVAKQRVDPATGGGYWAVARNAPPGEALRATRLALATLSLASGVPF